MSETESVQIVDAGGLTFTAWLKPVVSDLGTSQVMLRLSDGTQFMIPSDLLTAQDSGRYTLSVSLREYARNPEVVDEAQATQVGEADTVIQLAEETLKVGTRTVEHGQVRVTKRVVEREEIVDQPLMREEVMVEHISINQVVEQAAPVRYEGDTTIIPLYEEVLVFEKRLMLVEEVRVTRRSSERRAPQQVVLRREEAVVERLVTEPDDEGR